MLRTRLALILGPVLVLGLAMGLVAGVPGRISYQGVLNDNLGNPVADGSYSVIFTIYFSATLATPVWSETQSVNTLGGQFAVELGSIVPISESVFEGRNRFLGVKVGADPEISPRTRLMSVPYAFRVATVDSSTGGRIEGDLQIGGSASVGVSNYNNGDDCFVSGQFNFVDAAARWSTITGGVFDSISADYCIVGGVSNHALAPYSFIGSGFGNRITHNYGSIVGGLRNQGSALYSFIGSGEDNTTTGEYSMIPGGRDNTAAGKYSFAAGRRGRANHGGSFVWADSTDADFTTTTGNSFIIRASGGVGIGTASPERTFHVQKNLAGAVTSNSNSIAVFENNATAYMSILTPAANESGILFEQVSNPADGGFIYNNTATPNGLQFRTNGNQTRMVIDDDGNVGIGFALVAPTRILQVIQGSATDPIADAWTTYSSRRWKTNIETIGEALTKVLDLRGVTYNLKADGRREIGLIAEEVGEVIPEIVQYEKNGRDAQSVDYSRLVAVLIEGMKEQQTQIRNLQNEIRELKSDSDRVCALMTKIERLQSSLEKAELTGK